MKANILILLLSLSLIILPATLIALGCLLILHTFLAPFLISLACIIILGQFVNIIVQKKTALQIETIKLRKAEAESSQNIEVTCSYCKARNILPIKLSTRNTFKCNSCKQENLVIFQFATAQITTPLVLPDYGKQPTN